MTMTPHLQRLEKHTEGADKAKRQLTVAGLPRAAGDP
jgi:hypothetical protein